MAEVMPTKPGTQTYELSWRFHSRVPVDMERLQDELFEHVSIAFHNALQLSVKGTEIMDWGVDSPEVRPISKAEYHGTVNPTKKKPVKSVKKADDWTGRG